MAIKHRVKIWFGEDDENTKFFDDVIKVLLPNGDKDELVITSASPINRFGKNKVSFKLSEIVKIEIGKKL